MSENQKQDYIESFIEYYSDTFEDWIWEYIHCNDTKPYYVEFLKGCIITESNVSIDDFINVVNEHMPHTFTDEFEKKLNAFFEKIINHIGD